MNNIQGLPLRSYKLLSRHLKSFYAATSQISTSLSSAQLHNGNSKLLLHPEHYATIQKTQIRNRYFRRRPIDVIENTKEAKYLVDWAEEQEHQAGELHNDETELPTQKNDEDSLADEETITKRSKMKRKGKKKKSLEEKEKSENKENLINKDRVFKNLNIQQYHKAIPKVRTYLEEGKSSYVREEDDFFYVEGCRLLAETLNKGLRPLAIFFSRSRLFYNLIPTVAKTETELASLLNLYPLYKTPYNIFKLWSSLKTPPGVIGVFKLSEAERKASPKRLKSEDSFPLTVILDEVRDPSNLGGIYRTLVAAGVEQVILMSGCCDIWDPKVFRATAGAQLHMSCLSKVQWKYLESHLPPTANVFLADSYCTRDFREIEEDEKFVNIEPTDERETLLLREKGLAESEDKTVIKTTEEGYEIQVNYSYDDVRHTQLFSNVEFPKVSYEEADFFNESLALQGQNSILIIGGEKGLSNNAKKFALESNAVQVGVPLLNDVESLNSSVANGILVYTAQRQYNSIKMKQKLESTDDDTEEQSLSDKT